ncbi:uncharacterized protein LOC134225080 [Armigeres subalbatus]|uniref:uncharacterized protein LOC134225080 n=1 Tax=Armigeres subalbatus TaxID=124917 RepID=UPI002ED6862A
MYPPHHTQIYIILLLILVTTSNSANERSAEKGRYFAPWVVFPPTAPTRHQLITGIGIPLGTVESVISGWVLKAQYFLPTSTNDLHPVFFEGWNDSRRAVEKREAINVTPVENMETHQADTVNIDSDSSAREDDDLFDDTDDYWATLDDEQHLRDADQRVQSTNKYPEGYNTERSRWTTYKALDQIGAIYGAGGRGCVLRSICEAASAEFTHTGGVFAELLHILFTPSTTTEPLSDHSDNEYYRAEQLGKDGAPCHLVFCECQNSLLDIFTGVHDTETNVLRVMHDKLVKRSV